LEARVQEEEFIWGQEAFGLYYRDHRLVYGGYAAVPVALVVAKGLREGLQARHGGHFLDAID
jgi:hypothetical protein